MAVARSNLPGCLEEVDKTMEEHYMRWSKSGSGAGGAGITGLLRNPEALNRWVKTASERSNYYQQCMQCVASKSTPKKKKGNTGKH